MAAPYILQLLFGQPKIGLVFNHDDKGSEGRIIKIHLMNPPINNWILKTCKVSRLPAQDVYLTIRVLDASTRQVVVGSFLPDISLSPSSKAGRVSLPPSILTAWVNLAKWQRSTNSAVLLYGTSPIPLEKGTYIVDIRIGLDGETKICKPSLLYIGEIETEMIWDKNITNKFLV